MQPKVSVIIPVYKVEKFIERCVRSLFEQTLEDIEYIFVNDCTPDKSIDVLLGVLNEYLNRKQQVRIIEHSSNMGSAKVRLDGMKAATGKYIIHCDSDDWVDTNLYKSLYDKAEQTGADIVTCDFVCEYASGKKSVSYENPMSDNPRQLLRQMHLKSFYCMTWCRLMRSDFVERYQLYPMPGIDMWEDVSIMLPAFYYANKVEKVNGTLYHYFVNDQSLTAQGCSDKSFRDRKATVEFLEAFFTDKHDADYHLLVSLWKLLAKSFLLQSQAFDPKQWKKEYPEVENDILKIKAFPLSQRALYYVTSKTTLPITCLGIIVKFLRNQ